MPGAEFPEIGTAEVALRLGLVTVLCGLVGLEREIRGHEAGLRTHILVGLGAALFTLVSAYGFEEFFAAERSGGRIGYDPTRIAAQIVTGIGFLGAGVILRREGVVHGLTTAAGLWVAAAIGMGGAAGYYEGTAIATALALVALVLLRPVTEAVGDDAERERREELRRRRGPDGGP